MSDASPVSLKWDARSEQLLKLWPSLKVAQIDEVISRWSKTMEAWMLRETTKSFQDQKQPGGSSWPRNSFETLSMKAAKGKSTLTNIYTAKLRSSISSEHTKSTAKVGSPLDYSIYTQDRSDSSLNRPILPKEEYAGEYGEQLAGRLVREKVR